MDGAACSELAIDLTAPLGTVRLTSMRTPFGAMLGCTCKAPVAPIGVDGKLLAVAAVCHCWAVRLWWVASSGAKDVGWHWDAGTRGSGAGGWLGEHPKGV